MGFLSEISSGVLSHTCAWYGKKHDQVSQNTINESVEKVFMSSYRFYLNVFVHT